MSEQYDIFISYKRKSLATANNLYYRLTTRGYSTFFDLEEMRKDNFDVQLLQHIEHAKDVFVILEEGSLDGCQTEDWEEKDWFCHEIAFALEKKKNIIPILLGGYKMPGEYFFPDKLKELSLKHSPDFSLSFFDAYLDKLIEKKFITSEARVQNRTTSVFKFYSNENCLVFKDGKLVCSLEGMSDTPYYLPVQRKGDYRFKVVNAITAEQKLYKINIDSEQDKEIEFEWEERKPQEPDQPSPEGVIISGEAYSVEVGDLMFNMIRVEGGEMTIGVTREQLEEVEDNEHPAHIVSLPTYYIGQFPVTQNVWRLVMGYNKSKNQEKEETKKGSSSSGIKGALIGGTVGLVFGPLGSILGGAAGYLAAKIFQDDDAVGHYPVENLSYEEALEFVCRLSEMTGIKFSIPTEEEWEYAARGGQQSQGYKYAGSNDISEVAWYSKTSDSCTHPVGGKAPNELGIFDMCGNVWEWTSTPAHTYSSEVDADGDVYICRGGSWRNKAQNCRVSHRSATKKSKKSGGLGLRVVIRENVE